MSDKLYHSTRQLVKILREKNISIEKGSQGSKVIKILSLENYYNVVNGYKDLFIDRSITTKEQFRNGTTFEEIYSLFCFDRNIRNLFLKYLLKIENSFKTVLSSVFSKEYGHENYLIFDNFNTNANVTKKNLARIAAKNNLDLSKKQQYNEAVKISQTEVLSNLAALFSKIHNEVSRHLTKNNACIKHYMTKYGYVPLWVLVNILTFGKICDFYLNMKDNDKILIASKFDIQFRELHKAVDMLALARNYCAHGNRFFDIKFKKSLSFNQYNKIIRKKVEFNNLGLPVANGNYLKGSKDLFAIVILFTQFLGKSEMKDFIKSMQNEIDILSKNLKTISVDNVLDNMGFPSNWRNVFKLC